MAVAEGDGEEDAFDEHYEDKAKEVMGGQKVNSSKVILSMEVPGGNLFIPLCRMISMPSVRPALRNDITKLKNDFVHGYVKGSAVFYVSTVNTKGEECLVTEDIEQSWDACWREVNREFEAKLSKKASTKAFMGKMFFVWDGNHRLLAWMDYISSLHSDEIEWHWSVVSMVLDHKGRVTQLLTAMHDINK